MASSFPTGFSSPADYDACLVAELQQQWQQWQQRQQQEQQIDTLLTEYCWDGSPQETTAQLPGTFVANQHPQQAPWYQHRSDAIMGPSPFCLPPHSSNGFNASSYTYSNGQHHRAPDNATGWAQNYPVQEQQKRPLPVEGASLLQDAEGKFNPWMDARHQQKVMEPILAHQAAGLPPKDLATALLLQQQVSLPEPMAQQTFMKRSTCIDAFPFKLFSILLDPRNSKCMRWNSDGRSFCILDRKALEKEILPRYFYGGKLTTFLRQLNKWGFKRLGSIPYCSYYHENFVEHHPELCRKISRRASKAAAAKERDGIDAAWPPTAVAPSRDGGDGGKDREVIVIDDDDDDGRLENLSQHQPHPSEMNGDQSGNGGQQKISRSASDPKTRWLHFPAQLHQMLKDPDFSKFLCWNADGRSWRILDRLLLTQKLNPAKYASFMGEIDVWGFTRCIDGYFHRQFVRENPDLCFFMERKTIGQYEHAHSVEQAQPKEFDRPTFTCNTDALEKRERPQQQKASSIETISDDSKAIPTNLHNIDSVPTPRKPIATPQKPDEFPEDYEPGHLDVLSGRGKKLSGRGKTSQTGKDFFRKIVHTHLAEHMNAPTKAEKSKIVKQIVDYMRQQGYRFLCKNWKGRYYDIGDKNTYWKTDCALHEMARSFRRGRIKLKQLQHDGTAMSVSENEADNDESHYKVLPQEEQKQLQHERTAMSVSGNDADNEESHYKVLPQEEQKQLQHGGTAMSLSENEADNEESHYKVLPQEEQKQLQQEGTAMSVSENDADNEESHYRVLPQEQQKQRQHGGTAMSVMENEADNEESHYKVLARLNPQLCLAVKSFLLTGQKVQTEGDNVGVPTLTTVEIDKAVSGLIDFEEWILKKRKLLQQQQQYLTGQKVQTEGKIDKAVSRLIDFEEWISKKRRLLQQQQQYDGTAIALRENEANTDESPSLQQQQQYEVALRENEADAGESPSLQQQQQYDVALRENEANTDESPSLQQQQQYEVALRENEADAGESPSLQQQQQYDVALRENETDAESPSLQHQQQYDVALRDNEADAGESPSLQQQQQYDVALRENEADTDESPSLQQQQQYDVALRDNEADADEAPSLQQQQQYDGTALRENEADTDESPSPVNPNLHLAMESIRKTDLQLPTESISQNCGGSVVSKGSSVGFAAVWSSCSNIPPG